MPASIASIDFHGLPGLRLAAGDGATALLTLHGAHTVSWRPAGGGERLYLSERSAFAPGQAIRGGVPVIFPQFADLGPLPRHGFARTATWQALDARSGPDYALATLRFSDSEATRAIWPHPFAAELTVAVGGNRLDMELEIENPGAPCAFTCGLHTYLRLAEVETARLEGLRGLRYRDRAAGGEAVQRGDSLVVADELDRIYRDVGEKPLLLRAPEGSTAIRMEGFEDLVVWNPWQEKTAALADLPPGGFRRMLCVEAAAIEHPIRLASGESWWGRQSLVAL
jgi:glucose-6-phosphate 1-epimerase